MRVVPVLALALTAFGCGSGEPSFLYEPPEPGLQAEPPWLSFTCTRPGCASTRSSTVTVVGGRDIAIRRVILSTPEHPEFTIAPARGAPFVLEADATLPIAVEHHPTGDPRIEDPVIRVAYTDASVSESDDRVEPGELKIPLVRRLVGEAALSIEPEEVLFGAVPPGRSKTTQVILRNVGFGNVGLTFEDVSVDPAGELVLGPTPPSIGPGEAVELDLTWTPSAESFLQGTLRLQPFGQELPSVVPVFGTSYVGPKIGVEPADSIDFGAVDVGSTAVAQVDITNRGGEELRLGDVSVRNVGSAADVALAWTSGADTSSVAPLRTASLELRLTANAPAVLGGELFIRSNDPTAPNTRIPLTGLLAKPVLSVSPREIDFGAVPQGWTRTRTIELENAGYGELVVDDVSLVLGSSELFGLRTVPELPARLAHDERLTLELEFRSEAAASFSGTLAVRSNDPDTPFFELPLGARGTTCEEGCPIANGTPDCSAGMCEVGACDEGFHDTDSDPANGCECREPNPRGDPGAFCADSIYLGSIDDDGESLSFTGIVPNTDDVDIIRVHAHDSSQFFSDDYDVRITLSSSDPGLELCVFRHDTENHTNECFFENERCGRSFRRDGSLGREDGADYILRVRRRPGSSPTCTTYSIFARNG